MSLRGKVRKLPFTEKEIQAMFDDYNDDMPSQELYEKHHVREDQLKYLRKKYGVPARQTYVQKVVAAAVADHVNGMLLKDVEKKYGISHLTIYRYMKKHNIMYKNGHGRKYHLNEDYFDLIDDEHKAYWLGFLYADGSVCRSSDTAISPNRLSINLSHKDRCILERLLEDLNADYNIWDHMPNERTYGNSMISSLSINSAKLCHNLIRHGCFPNKTHFLRFPYGSMQEKLYHHFIRGLFDGDGCITATEKALKFSITGYNEFLLEVQCVLMKNCNLNRTSLSYYPNKSQDVASLSYGGSLVCRRIYDYLYQDATIYLPRKYEKYTLLLS